MPHRVYVIVDRFDHPFEGVQDRRRVGPGERRVARHVQFDRRGHQFGRRWVVVVVDADADVV